MPDKQSAAQTAVQQARTTSIQERSIRVGDVIVVNGYRVNRSALTARFAEGGYCVRETRHFLLFTRAEKPKLILVHWFAPEELHTNLSHYLAEELKPFDVITSNYVLGELMTGIVGGTLYPDDVRKAWNYFGANTLQHLLTLVSSTLPSHLPDYGSLGASATLYQRVIELSLGERFLDAACNGGYFPLLIAERIPFVSEVVGVDRDPAVFQVAQELANERGLTSVRYLQADLLADLSTVGRFDTVSALHVLEHFTEAEMYRVLANLLNVTAHRLIVAVPYEEDQPSPAYDHKQLFTQAKLQAVGVWCIEHLHGAARMWYEDIAPPGGLLLIERHPA